MNAWAEQLYRLLPAVHQVRDGEQGEPLRQLLAVIGEQVQSMQEDIDGLYDNWFIETCNSWVVPYLGDLVGFEQTAGAGVPADPNSQRGRILNRLLYSRREIANLVHRRRRKGTLSVLEDVARDVTGWPSRAVEFGPLVQTFQHSRFPNDGLGGTLDVRSRGLGARLNTPFDQTAHTVDLHAMQSIPGVGWRHPLKVGLFVWRRSSHVLEQVTPLHECTHGEKPALPLYTLNRLGFLQPLVVGQVDETNEYSQADERHVPTLLRRDLLSDADGRPLCRFYGSRPDGVAKSLAIFKRKSIRDSWTPVPKNKVLVCDLTTRPAQRIACSTLRATNAEAAVDPECGRLLLTTKPAGGVRATYYQPFTGTIGGGSYRRQLAPRDRWMSIRVAASHDSAALLPADLLKAARAESIKVAEAEASSGPPPLDLFAIVDDQWTPVLSEKGPSVTGQAAGDSKIEMWRVSRDACIEILDSENYKIQMDRPLRIDDGRTLEIRGVDGHCPLLQLTSPNGLTCSDDWVVELGAGSQLILDGVHLCGATLRVRTSQGVLGDASSDATAQEGGASPSAKVASSCGCGPAAVPVAVSTTGTNAEWRPIQPARPARIVVRHVTLTPNAAPHDASCRGEARQASLSIALDGGRCDILNSIVGTLNIEHAKCSCGRQEQSLGDCPENPLALHITDSIVDASWGRLALGSECCWPAHADLTVERSTFLGDVCVQQISSAEDSIFRDIVHVQRRSHGYMRFCYVPTDAASLNLLCDDLPLRRIRAVMHAMWRKWLKPLIRDGDHYSPIKDYDLVRTPTRFKCLPESTSGAISPAQCESACRTPADASPHAVVLLPKFVSTCYGEPGYCELSWDCPAEILRGAEDESELGAFHDNYWPQRRAALEDRLRDYSPAEMESAVILADDLPPPPAAHCR